VTDQQSKSSDDSVAQQPGLSASALLKQHEMTMKATNGKKRSRETRSDADADDHRLTDGCVTPASIITDRNQCSDSSTVIDSSAESKRVKDASTTESALAQQRDRSSEGTEQASSQLLKHVVKPQHKVPELGRGLNVSCSGVVDLDDIPCLSAPSTVTADSAKVSRLPSVILH